MVDIEMPLQKRTVTPLMSLVTFLTVNHMCLSHFQMVSGCGACGSVFSFTQSHGNLSYDGQLTCQMPSQGYLWWTVYRMGWLHRKLVLQLGEPPYWQTHVLSSLEAHYVGKPLCCPFCRAILVPQLMATCYKMKSRSSNMSNRIMVMLYVYCKSCVILILFYLNCCK